MRRLTYLVIGLLLMITAVYVLVRLLQTRQMLTLAMLAPAILAAAAFGATLVFRVLRGSGPAH